MTFLEVVLIAVGLAMDCTAVSIANSICVKQYNWPKMLRMALFFGLFQGGMPLICFTLGRTFATTIEHVDHWLALVILGYIGGKMIVESFRSKSEACMKSPFDSFKRLLALSVATSIDALATGLLFVPFPNMIWWVVGVIALVSFLFSLMGCVIGVSCGKRFHINVELIGGLILIGIGLKIFISHMFF